MRSIYLYSFIGLCLCFFSSCSDNTDVKDVESGDMTKEIIIDANQTFQTIEGFAASDCWAPQYVGKYWDDDVKLAISRSLFSQEITGNTPKGIGLSMWRFNLGGGTAEQGDASGIVDKSRRAECFLQEDGTLDWNHQLGQQYFLQKAFEFGCRKFVMFSNTPPVYYTNNGKGYSAMGAYSNLKEGFYESFADYITDVLDYFKKNRNIDFSLISPVNEPQYNWNDPSQEGSGWQNSEIKQLVVDLDQSLRNKGLATKILLPEVADWEYAYKRKNDVGRSDCINNIFNSSSANYLGDLETVYQAIAGHSYWTDRTWNNLYDVRSQLATAASAHNLKVYQTEWSMLGDGYNENYPGHDNASYMDIALYMSKVIYADMTFANASSWSYWTSMDVERWGHKSRFLLIKLNPAGGAYGDISESGTYESTKNLWVLGNYSLFIRPGYQRINLSIANASNLFFGSAYLSPDKNKLVAVYTNLSDKSIALNTTFRGLSKEFSSVKRYVTSQVKDLEGEDLENDHCTIQPKSVMTLVYELK
ncbi:glycoside hydrolase [uncultured Bacteroides sp.]|uniref:glycoside hydrolase n=1 Tax=uncultured Bacteroides sp. TaxID=162156 RepID=UPI002AAAA414|nr:glycoside hydrolase [uncultured Bacteroides sp.]